MQAGINILAMRPLCLVQSAVPLRWCPFIIFGG